MTTPEFLIFLLVYTPAAMLVGWSLCLAASKKQPPNQQKDNANDHKNN